MLQEVDDFLLACDSEETTKEIFNAIGTPIRFDIEKQGENILFEFLGIVRDLMALTSSKRSTTSK